MVEIMETRHVHMKKGMATIYIVNMHGHRMVAFPAEMVPPGLIQGEYDYGQ
jgi:hypothetical protein